MTISLARLVVPLVVLLPMPALAAGLPPWRFGMSKSEVVSFSEFGPYKNFKNGDVETFNGKFHGHKENIQFFFKNGRLVRIGIYLWEGRDPKQGIPVWQKAYGLLEKDYGKLEMPDIQALPGSDSPTAEVLAIAAATHADMLGRTEMAPIKQPADMRVFARFMADQPLGQGKTYVIAILLDSPP
jgi:hypothetical protein